MFQHTVPATFCCAIDELSIFTQFYISTDVFCIIFKDWNLLIVAIFNILIKFDSNYNINNLTFQTDDDSIIIDKYDESKTWQTKTLMISIGATHANNLNDNCTCLNFDNNQLINYHASRHGRYLLAETMTNRGIFTNPLTSTGQTGNGTKMRDKVAMYKFEKCKNSVRNYLSNTTLANIYSNGKTKCDFELTANEAAPSLGFEARIKYVKITNAVFYSYLHQNNGFYTMMMTLRFMDILLVLNSNACVDYSFKELV